MKSPFSSWRFAAVALAMSVGATRAQRVTDKKLTFEDMQACVAKYDGTNKRYQANGFLCRPWGSHDKKNGFQGWWFAAHEATDPPNPGSVVISEVLSHLRRGAVICIETDKGGVYADANGEIISDASTSGTNGKTTPTKPPAVNSDDMQLIGDSLKMYNVLQHH
jgi:hypothetical protein